MPLITNNPKSSAVHQVDYNPETLELHVTVPGGKRYTYPKVTAEEHNAFVSADSVGKYFATIISKRKHVK